MRLTSLCSALLVLDAAYCALALFTPGLPAWKMFDVAEHAQYSLRSGDGRAVDAYAWVPRAARDLGEADLVQVASWLCAGRRVALPLTLDTAGARRRFDAPDCAAHVVP